MKRLFVILMLAIVATAYFSHAGTAVDSVCYATDCPDGCGGDGGSDDPDGTGDGAGDDSGPDGTGDGSGDSGGGSDPDGSGGGGDF